MLVHTDAAQSVGKIPTRVADLGVDLLTIAGHKVYAPKGVGALYVRRGVPLEPLIHGAGHEAGPPRRHRERPPRGGPRRGLRARRRPRAAWTGIRAGCATASGTACALAFGDGVVLNGHPSERLPNTLNVSFVGRVGADILAALDGVAASTGAACHARIRSSSRRCCARWACRPIVGMGAVRLSLGRTTTESEIDEVLGRLASIPA